MKTVTIYTDGACSGNPGPGGWAAILEWNGREKELSGGEAETTNNRMELTAVIRALAMLKEPCAVELYSDSKYVIDALEKGWVYGWKKKGWVKSDKKPALNVDLWEQLLPLIGRHEVGGVAFPEERVVARFVDLDEIEGAGAALAEGCELCEPRAYLLDECRIGFLAHGLLHFHYLAEFVAESFKLLRRVVVEGEDGRFP